MKLTILVLLVLFIVPSCTIEKRLHNRGWNVQWWSHQKISKENSEIDEIIEEDIDASESRTINQNYSFTELELKKNELTFQEEAFVIDEVQTSITPKQSEETNIDEPVKTIYSKLKENKAEDAGEAQKVRRTGVIISIVGAVLFLGILWIPLFSLLIPMTLVDGVTILAMSFLSMFIGWILIIVGKKLIKRSKKMG